MTNIDNLTNNEITKFLASKSEDQILQELSAGSGFDMENPFIEDMFADNSNDELTTEEVVEEVVEEKPKKRKRRTKAQIEADRLKEEQAKQEENNELEDIDEDILDQTEEYIVDLNVLEPTKKEKVEKTKVVDNFFDDDFDFTTTKEEIKETKVSVDDLDDDFDFFGNDTPETEETRKPKKTVSDLLDNELSDIVIDVTAKEVTKPKPNKFERLREEEQKFKDAKLQNAIKQQNIIKEEASVERPKKAGVFGESMSEAEIEAMLNEQDKKVTTPTQQTPKMSNKTGKIPPKPTQPTKTVTKETKTDEIITTDERLEIKNKIKQIVKEELREQLLRKIVQEELQKMDLQDLIREEFNNIYNN